MKNGDLVVMGKKVSEQAFLSFEIPEKLTDWEIAAYEAYAGEEGEAKLDRDGIENLDDLFGKEWFEIWNKHRNVILAGKYIEEANKKIENLKKYIESLEKIVNDPPSHFPALSISTLLIF